MIICWCCAQTSSRQLVSINPNSEEQRDWPFDSGYSLSHSIVSWNLKVARPYVQSPPLAPTDGGDTSDANSTKHSCGCVVHELAPPIRLQIIARCVLICWTWSSNWFYPSWLGAMLINQVLPEQELLLKCWSRGNAEAIMLKRQSKPWPKYRFKRPKKYPRLVTMLPKAIAEMTTPLIVNPDSAVDSSIQVR